MAEPYDTISPLSPKLWYRFSDASGGVTNEGTGGGSFNLGEASGGSLGSFNWDYEFETAPDGVSSSMKANGGGGLESTATGMTSSRGTMILHIRAGSGTAASGGWLAGFYQSFDVDYVRIAIGSSGQLFYYIQDANNDDEIWNDDSTTLNDQNAHTIAVQPGTGTTSPPLTYVDGVATTPTKITGEDGVNDNWWWGNFAESIALGFRGGVNSSPEDDWVYYDFLCFETVLTAQQIEDVHNALQGITNFGTKTIRRTNRRLFPDYANL